MFQKFNVETVVDQAVSASKTLTGAIPFEPARKASEAIIEANAAFTKSAFVAVSDFFTALQKVSVTK